MIAWKWLWHFKLLVKHYRGRFVIATIRVLMGSCYCCAVTCFVSTFCNFYCGNISLCVWIMQETIGSASQFFSVAFIDEYSDLHCVHSPGQCSVLLYSELMLICVCVCIEMLAACISAWLQCTTCLEVVWNILDSLDGKYAQHVTLNAERPLCDGITRLGPFCLRIKIQQACAWYTTSPVLHSTLKKWVHPCGLT